MVRINKFLEDNVYKVGRAQNQPKAEARPAGPNPDHERRFFVAHVKNLDKFGKSEH